MNKRKYKDKKPENTTERIEAIYEEFVESPQKGDYKPVETLKDFVSSLLTHVKSVERNKGYEKKTNELSQKATVWALFALSVLAFLFSIGNRNWDWLNNHRFAVILCGVAFAVMYVGVCLERSLFFKHLWKFGFIKVFTSILLSALVVFSTGKASSVINSVFGIDASAFPYTRAYVTGILVFKYASPLLTVVVLFATVHVVFIFIWVKSKGNDYELPPFDSIAFLLLSLIILCTSWYILNRYFSDKELPNKVYILAHSIDFNSKYRCANISTGMNVIFVGPDQLRVLVDVNKIEIDDIESFLKDSSQVNIPEKFYLLPCDTATNNAN